MKGVFISFEGIEGSGKSTQARLLSDFLKTKGIDSVLTQEPGGTPIGAEIRQLLLSTKHTRMDSVTELLLYAASRRQHIKEVIIPALEKGLVVITDRFSDSTKAYQGYGRGLSLELIDSLDRTATGGLKPDLTLLLDIDVKSGLQRNRKANKMDRLELEEITFHEKVRNGYLAIQKAEPERIKLLDASDSIEQVHNAVTDAVMKFISKRIKTQP
jgi:dTMP kinase